MEVNLNVNSAAPVPTANLQPRVAVQAGRTDAIEFSGSAALNHLLDEIPDVRPDAVARGRELIAQPNYPPSETIKKLAALFAFNLESKSGKP